MATIESFTQERIECARRTEVDGTHVLQICDDIGTCWHDLGIKLKLPRAILENINADYSLCREKAREMLYEWMNKEGSSATVGSLADALEDIGNKRVAQKLLGAKDVKDEKDTITIFSNNNEIEEEQNGKKEQQQQVKVSKLLQDGVKKELEQKDEKLKLLGEQHTRLQEESKKKEEAIKNLTSKLGIEQKRVQELEQKYEKLKILDRQVTDLGNKVVEDLSSKLEHERQQMKKIAKDKEILEDEYKRVKDNQMRLALELEEAKKKQARRAKESGI